MRRLCHFILPLLLLAAAAAAQPVPENTPVGRVRVEFQGIQNVSEEAVMAHIRVEEGQPYSEALMDRSIRSLHNTGLFEYIGADTELLDDGNAAVTFTVRSKYRIQQVRFAGNRKFSDRELRKKITLKKGRMLDERVIRKDRDEIYEYYLKKGFSRASVEYEVEKDPAAGLSRVTFRIEEGPRLYISKIRFTGNQAFSSRKLRGRMETKKWWFLSWLTGSGRYKEEVLEEDLRRLRDFYKNEGYLDIHISESNVKLEYPSPGRMAITIAVDEGRQYRMGEIHLEGNTLFGAEPLKRGLRLRPDSVFSPKKLDEDRERLRDVYGSAGYLDTTVRAERIPNIETGNIDVLYIINESDKFHVESIKIEGNTKTKSIVIVRELALAPGDVFDLVRMKNSEARLKNTRFFEQVNLAPESTNIPGRRNLKITVEEARTGQLEVGAGFSSLESAMFYFEISQSNFDLFNWRSFFQGDGQKFRLRMSLGTSSKEAVLSMEEPWFLERRLALGFEAYHRDMKYYSAYYDEIRTGFEVYMRKRLFELVNGRLSWTLERIQIKDVAFYSPSFILDHKGTFSTSAAGLSLTRDTRDSFIYPTRGNRVHQSFTLAGLGGDSRYLKIENRSSIFIPVFERGEQVLSLLGRAGMLFETGDPQDVFFTDRYYLGGPHTLRGFKYREVGPKSREPGSSLTEPTGGNSYLFGSAEYTVKLAEALRLAVFYDCGIVYAETGFSHNDDPDRLIYNGTFNDNWGAGLRILVAGSPLRLDYGIPITTDDDNDEGKQFNFSFGTRF